MAFGHFLEESWKTMRLRFFPKKFGGGNSKKMQFHLKTLGKYVFQFDYSYDIFQMGG